MIKINWGLLIVSVVIIMVVAGGGGLFTSANTGSEWYESIKPSITPPNWIFPIVWNILFLLIAISLYLILISKEQKTKVLIAYLINFILNILWSFLFFSQKLTKIAFFELLVLWISVIFMISLAYKIDKKAAYLLVPYLLWLTFAGILNYLAAF